MDDTLPIFEPVEDLPTITDSELHRLLFRPVDPDIERAEQACRSGDTDRATRYIEQLQHLCTPVESLQICLLGAIESETHGLVRMLLCTGVPISPLVIKLALQHNSQSVLSMFVELGWDINQEEA